MDAEAAYRVVAEHPHVLVARGFQHFRALLPRIAPERLVVLRPVEANVQGRHAPGVAPVPIENHVVLVLRQAFAPGAEETGPVALLMHGALETLAEARRIQSELGRAGALVAVAADHPVRMGPVDVAETGQVHAVRPRRHADPRLGLEFGHDARRAALVDMVHQVAAERAAGVEVEAEVG